MKLIVAMLIQLTISSIEASIFSRNVKNMLSQK